MCRHETLVVDDEMNKYLTISGETIEYSPNTLVLAAFMDRVRTASEDPKVLVVQLEAMVYGFENPLLDKDIIPGRAVVTKATYEHPCFHVMLDMIGRKRAATGHLDLAAARARHTMTVQQAAKHLDITEGAVRQAIHSGRLSSWREAGVYYLDPVVVTAYRVSRRGPPPTATPLEVRCGAEEGVVFKVKTPIELSGRKKSKNVVTGLAEGWKRIAVLASKGDSARLFVLEVSKNSNLISLHNFFVRGKFDIIVTENNAAKAREAFKKFVAE